MSHLTDEVLISMALSQWANHIETGNRTVSAENAKLMGHEEQALTDQQRKFVQRLRDLAKTALRAENER